MLSSPAVSVILVEGDPARRQRWREALESASGFLIVGEGDTVVEAASNAACAGAQADVLLINGDLPEAGNLKTWAIVRGLMGLPFRLAAISGGEDPRRLEVLMAAGLAALHPPTLDPEVLRRLVRNAASRTVDFHPRLADRIRQYLAGVETATKLRIGGLWIDLDQGQVSLLGKDLELTPLELSLLAYLARNRGRAVSARELLEGVWHTPLGRGGTVDQVKSCIWRLRCKIEPDTRRPRYLRSVRGEGYSLADPGLNPLN